jgi:Protein of unknown function (DUF5131)
MSAGTSIEWTEVTWNPTTGCDRISPGCDNCYALTLAKRLKAMGQAKYQHNGDPRTSGPGFGVTVHEDVLWACVFHRASAGAAQFGTGSSRACRKAVQEEPRSCRDGMQPKPGLIGVRSARVRAFRVAHGPE